MQSAFRLWVELRADSGSRCRHYNRDDVNQLVGFMRHVKNPPRFLELIAFSLRFGRPVQVCAGCSGVHDRHNKLGLGNPFDHIVRLLLRRQVQPNGESEWWREMCWHGDQNGGHHRGRGRSKSNRRKPPMLDERVGTPWCTG